MTRWIATAVALTALLSGTALAADDARIREWIVIGDGYVPRATMTQTDGPSPVAERETDGRWAGVEDGYVFVEPGTATPRPAMPGAVCSHDRCPDDGCETAAPTQWLAKGDGYVPMDSGGGTARMLCC